MKETMYKLHRKLLQKGQSKGGFTLVELIVVLVIMGLLTAALVPTVTGYVGDAEEKVDASNLYMVEQAAQMYLADQQLAGNTTAPDDLTASQLETAGYLSGLADDKDYTITYTAVSGSDNRYTIEVAETAREAGN